VTQSVEQVVRTFRKAVAVNRGNSTPAKARAFLLRAGIVEKNKKSPNGVRLAKQFR
jgi:predicted transcriptional regulator